MKTKKNILILVPCDEEQKNRILECCSEKWKVQFTDSRTFREMVSLGVQQNELLLNTEMIVGEPDIPDLIQLPNLRWIQMTWAGTDKYTRNPGFPSHVLLTNASGAFGVIISEYVLGGILTLYRNFPRYRELQKGHLWRDGGSERSLWGKRALILGTGNIGSETAKRLKAFEVTTVGLNSTGHGAPYFDETKALKLIDEELPKADVVIGCIPNHPDTIGLLDCKRMRTIKPGAVFVNVGRGLLTEPGALEEALQAGILSGAVLDVHTAEPLPADSALWDMEQVLITPHIAGPSFQHCRDTENRIWDIFLDNLAHYQAGRSLEHVVEVPEELRS